MSMEKNYLSFNPEIWGGIECTINRTNNIWTDQLLVAGHYSRDEDIGRLAELGITALRYPILWERHQPEKGRMIDWRWAGRQLNSMREHDITPIVGLLHHGSGPAFTDLASPGFAADFASYAGKVAARFPWLEYYTPINEPLTTARFSGLYGIWYPHQKNPLLFVRMLLNQAKGVVCAMKAIRIINPSAKLIQTEDLARVHGTPSLTYQRDFENNRRWLTFDLLMGRVDKQHPLWQYFLHIGIKEEELAFFIDNPCIPDIIGVNYYVTSERFLDEDLTRHPAHTHGGNGIHTYADTEAVRQLTPSGLYALLLETWQRYKLPISVTEAHLNCTREEQMRWLKEIWDLSCRVKKTGVDIRAVTAWALLGAYDWDSLLTRNNGHYESGAYKISGNKLHLTAVGNLIKSLAADGEYDHPLLEQQGWWHNPDREETRQLHEQGSLLIIGTEQDAHRQWIEICLARGVAVNFLHFADDLSFEEEVATNIELYHPWGILILSSNILFDVEAVQLVAAACRLIGIAFSNLIIEDDKGVDAINEMLNVFIDQAIACDVDVKRRSWPVEA